MTQNKNENSKIPFTVQILCSLKVPCGVLNALEQCCDERVPVLFASCALPTCTQERTRTVLYMDVGEEIHIPADSFTQHYCTERQPVTVTCQETAIHQHNAG